MVFRICTHIHNHLFLLRQMPLVSSHMTVATARGYKVQQFSLVILSSLEESKLKPRVTQNILTT